MNYKMAMEYLEDEKCSDQDNFFDNANDIGSAESLITSSDSTKEMKEHGENLLDF